MFRRFAPWQREAKFRETTFFSNVDPSRLYSAP